MESSSRPGGTAWTERQAGYSLEIGPNGFLDNKPSILSLCSQLGLTDSLIRANSAAAKRFVFLGDKLRALPGSPKQFLLSDLLTWSGKLRVLSERWRKAACPADESIYDFGCRRIGKEATEKLLDAFVTGVLAGDPRLLSLPACFPRMAELEREYGSLIRAQGKLAKQRRLARQTGQQQAVGSPTGTLAAPAGGMRTLIDALAEPLGPDLHFGEAVQSLQSSADGRWLVRSSQKIYRTEAVVLACPAYVQHDILSEVDGSLAAEIGGIPYSCAVVAVVGFRRTDLNCDLDGFGYLTPQSLKRPVLGVLWSSSIFPNQAPPDEFQFRAILGGWQRQDVLQWDDAQVIGAVLDDLRQTMGIQAEPTFTWVRRWEKAIPQYHVGHLERLKRIEERRRLHSGLFLTGNAYRGVSLNDCTREGELTAIGAAGYLSGQSDAKTERQG